MQVKKIVGHAAPAAFTAQVEALARAHHADLVVDCTRAYHFGARYNVELEIILPGDMTVRESHDIALELQHKVRLCSCLGSGLPPGSDGHAAASFSHSNGTSTPFFHKCADLRSMPPGSQ